MLAIGHSSSPWDIDSPPLPALPLPLLGEGGQGDRLLNDLYYILNGGVLTTLQRHGSLMAFCLGGLHRYAHYRMIQLAARLMWI